MMNNPQTVVTLRSASIIRGRIVTTEGKPIPGVRVATEEIESFTNNCRFGS